MSNSIERLQKFDMEDQSRAGEDQLTSATTQRSFIRAELSDSQFYSEDTFFIKGKAFLLFKRLRNCDMTQKNVLDLIVKV